MSDKPFFGAEGLAKSLDLGSQDDLLGLSSKGVSGLVFDENFCLTKADLVDSIYDTLPFDKIKAAKIVEDLIELIKVGLEKDGKVMLSGFGVFEVKSKKSRPGRNPQTGERITLAPRKVVKFKPSQILKKQVNDGEGA